MRTDSPVRGNLITALRQFAHAPPKKPPAEPCEICSARLNETHTHLFEPAARKLLCACEPCAVVLSSGQGGRFKRVPTVVELLHDFRLSDGVWEDLHVPIDLAFFVRNTLAERVLAFYPSPAGAVESSLTFDRWDALQDENPALKTFQPDVEALLVNRMENHQAIYRAPIDVCFEVVGLFRMHWRGLSGGPLVRDELAQFFHRLNERSCRK